MAQPNIQEIFSSETTRKILDQVVDHSQVQFRDIRDAQGLDTESTRKTLDHLKDAHLIEEQGAPLEDFSLFYVTAEGLEARRKLR